jgi:hypothetical protein
MIKRRFIVVQRRCIISRRNASFKKKKFSQRMLVELMLLIIFELPYRISFCCLLQTFIEQTITVLMMLYVLVYPIDKTIKVLTDKESNKKSLRKKKVYLF